MNTQKGFAPILIILLGLVVIGGGVYVYINKKSEIPTNQNEEITNIPTSDAGIIVTSIKSDDLVKFPISIEGYLDGQGWTANEGEIGTVEIFDANGKSVSNREVIQTTTDWLKFPTYFKVTVGDRQMMSYIKTDTGFVKIIGSGAKDGEQIKSVSIPVRFLAI